MTKLITLLPFFVFSILGYSQKLDVSHVNLYINMGLSPFENKLYIDDGSGSIFNYAEKPSLDSEFGFNCYTNNSWAVGINVGECQIDINSLKLKEFILSQNDFKDYYTNFTNGRSYSINYTGITIQKVLKFRCLYIEPGVDLSKIGGSMKYSLYSKIKKKGYHELRRISYNTITRKTFDSFMVNPSIKISHDILEMTENFIVGINLQYKYFPRIHCSTKLNREDENLIFGGFTKTSECYNKDISNHSITTGIYCKIIPIS